MVNCNLFFILPLLVLFYGFIVVQSFFYYYYDYFASKFEDAGTTFDFIVVGAGSSGSLMANILSRNNKVLLIEAGGDPLSIQSLPGLAVEFLHKPQIDWMYETVPQKYSHFGQTQTNISRWPRGRNLGGSSNLNYMMYVRSHPYDYDSWRNLTGDDRWAYSNLIKYFKKSINYNGKFPQNEKHYGKGKLENVLSVENAAVDREPILPYFLEAGKELGFEAVNDLNGPQRTGFGSIEYTTKNGARSGTYKSFLKPILDRKNLVISRYSHAVKIQLDKNNRATGIWYVRHGQKKFAKAVKEVIVSCGSIGSPQLLMLSGIGPSTHLKSLKIKPRIDLPVGQNLQDHIAVPLPPAVVDDAVPAENYHSLFPDWDYSIPAFYDYYVNGKGPLTMASPFNSQAFITTSDELKRTGLDWPNIQIFSNNVGAYEFMSEDLSRSYGFKQETLEAMWVPIKGKRCVNFITTLVRPKSIGQITLRDKNPLSHPLIDPNYLQDKRDVAALVESIQLLVKLMESTKSFKKLGATFSRTALPGCEKHKVMSNEYWECFVAHMGITLYHPAGTCRMGKRHGDSKAVVDSSMRVLHTGTSLRVIDASIMMNVVNGNTNAATIMIAELGADMIRQFWSQQYLVSPRQYWPFQTKHILSKCFYSQLV